MPAKSPKPNGRAAKRSLPGSVATPESEGEPPAHPTSARTSPDAERGATPGSPGSGSSLSDPVLVLNRAWIPVGIANVRDALCMMAREVALVVRPGTYELFDMLTWMERDPDLGVPCIQAVSTIVQAPEIIHLTYFDKVPRHEAAYSKRNVYIRDRASCQYCGVTPGWSKLTIDHVMPRSRGGPTSWENCVVACKPCNNRKGDRTPKEARMRLRSEPQRPHWRSFLHGVRPRPSWGPFVQLGEQELELIEAQSIMPHAQRVG